MRTYGLHIYWSKDDMPKIPKKYKVKGGCPVVVHDGSGKKFYIGKGKDGGNVLYPLLRKADNQSWIDCENTIVLP